MIISQLCHQNSRNKIYKEQIIPASFARFSDKATLVDGQTDFKARVIDCTIGEAQRDKAVCPYCGHPLNFFGYHYKAFKDELNECLYAVMDSNNVYYLKCNRMQCTNHDCRGKTRLRISKTQDSNQPNESKEQDGTQVQCGHAKATDNKKAKKKKPIVLVAHTQKHRPTHLVLSPISFPFTSLSLDTVEALIILKNDNDIKAVYRHIRKCLQLEKNAANDERVQSIALYLQALLLEPTAKLIFKVYNNISRMLNSGLSAQKEHDKSQKAGGVKESSDFVPEDCSDFLKQHTSAAYRLQALLTHHFPNVSTHLLWLEGLLDMKIDSS
ncbi:hypothetical protein [Anaerobiospirillum thomasii]|uniref:Uncharacterized protein n=1 Tax=Anaerobiospirillum thomasii TaxID=179995 RepID=A0A2X0WHI4_9GAMM|nr:hypothetical protein [Anaerobiospirillum thomasii]SPT69887.1 Uncharacterised protein [Anaerobiospirillum thomasii]